MRMVLRGEQTERRKTFIGGAYLVCIRYQTHCFISEGLGGQI